jgi:long-chain acyl-CoA synthetase
MDPRRINANYSNSHSIRHTWRRRSVILLGRSAGKSNLPQPSTSAASHKSATQCTACQISRVQQDPPQPLIRQHLDQLKAEHTDVAIWSFEEFMRLGDELVEPVPPNPEGLMCIMYTSGSTGPPKGVLLKHSTVVASIAGVDTIIGPHVAPGERVLAYLPLAHIIEFVLENATLYWGGVLGYGSPRTLTDDSVRRCDGDLRAFKPTFMVGVPAVWETVKKGIISRVGEPYSLRSRLFSGALSAKEMIFHWGLPGVNFLDSIVFNQVKAATGGNLRFCLNGGGAIGEATQKFISLVICPMLGGYGLTETAG